MRIDEEKVYIFKFPYQQTDFTIPVRAENKQEAVDILQKWLSGVQTELAMEFPKVFNAPNFTVEDAKKIVPGDILRVSSVPPEVLEMRIDTLMLDLGGGQLKGKAKVQTIELWTGLENIEANYTGIVTALEEIKTGVREIPTKNGKK